MSDLMVRGIVAALDIVRTREGSKYGMARKLGVSIVTADRWKHGVSTPSEQNLARLANAAGWTQEDIRNGGAE